MASFPTNGINSSSALPYLKLDELSVSTPHSDKKSPSASQTKHKALGIAVLKFGNPDQVETPPILNRVDRGVNPEANEKDKAIRQFALRFSNPEEVKTPPGPDKVEKPWALVISRAVKNYYACLFRYEIEMHGRKQQLEPEAKIPEVFTSAAEAKNPQEIPFLGRIPPKIKGLEPDWKKYFARLDPALYEARILELEEHLNKFPLMKIMKVDVFDLKFRYWEHFFNKIYPERPDDFFQRCRLFDVCDSLIHYNSLPVGKFRAVHYKDLSYSLPHARNEDDYTYVILTIINYMLGAIAVSTKYYREQSKEYLDCIRTLMNKFEKPGEINRLMETIKTLIVYKKSETDYSSNPKRFRNIRKIIKGFIKEENQRIAKSDLINKKSNNRCVIS